MGCCNDPISALAGTQPDPTQHVNYARGMVLGVDDFTQEFAYLSERTRWLARDAIGYGTLSGLHVFHEVDGALGPRLHVSAGSALVPSGQQVCVGADQCCVINSWLARPENAALVNRLLNPASPPLSSPVSPPISPTPGESGAISLYLTLCWADCLTRPVPIPGEPCRSEDELMAPSRVADDYKLELREKAPLQTEEDALRDFVRWLRSNVQVVDASPPLAADEAAWHDALASAAGPWLSASPPLSPPASFDTLGDYLFDLAPPGIDLAADQLGSFLRVALRFWVTELRPLWMAMRCHQAQQADIDCLLLARVSFEVSWIGGSPTGAWQVTGSPPTVMVDESARPVLANLALLQAWLLDGVAAASATGGGAVSPPGPMPLSVTSTSVDLVLDASQDLVLAAGGQSIQLPLAAPANRGKVYIVKSIGSDSKVVPSGTDTIDGPTATPGQVKKGNAKSFASDGNNTWHLIATVA